MTLTNRPTKLPGFPKVPDDLSPQARQYLLAVVEALEIRLGRKGDPRDRAITLRELIDSGLAKELKAAPFDPNNTTDSNRGFGDPDIVDSAVPLTPTSFTASGAFENIHLTWDYPRYRGHSLTEIWRHTSNTIGDAILVATSNSRAYADPVGSGSVVYYYWIRHKNTGDVVGAWSSVQSAQTEANVNFLLDALSTDVTGSPLSTFLSSDVGSNIGSVPLWDANKAYAVGDMVRVISNPDSLGDRNHFFICRIAVPAPPASGHNDSPPTIDTTHNNANWDLIGDGRSARVTKNDVTTVTARIDGIADIDGSGTVTLEQRMTAQASANGQLAGQYTVKIDAGGRIAGFGLINTNNFSSSSTAADASSAFLIHADRFALCHPDYTVSVEASAVEWSSSSSYSAGAIIKRTVTSNDLTNANIVQYSAGNTNAVGVVRVFKCRTSHASSAGIDPLHKDQNKWDDIKTPPFTVQASSTTVTDGAPAPNTSTYTIERGVYIDGAHIRKASIQAAAIYNLNADVITTGKLNVTQLIDATTIEASKLILDNVTMEQTSIANPNGSGNVYALKVKAIDASIITVTNLTAQSITGDVNTITWFEDDTSSVTIGPTSAGYVEVMTVISPANAIVAHKHALSMVMSLRSRKDTIGVRVGYERANATTGNYANNYTYLDEMSTATASINGSWCTFPIIAADAGGAYFGAVKFVVEIKMYGDSGGWDTPSSNTTSESYGPAGGSGNYNSPPQKIMWRGYTLGIV